MSNVVDLRREQHLRSVSRPDEAMPRDVDLVVASPVVFWRAIVVEKVRSSVSLLDLAAQRARTMAVRIHDEQSRQNLIGQIEAIERQLQFARDMARAL
jgi:hypothetical protein